ncbi:Vms1/Ankzf1 family peptidyl-tRNA hydrolase [Halobacterium yunchengense]|uniref:Vms1/Ankzf1 family peptidyl-tRNA hydrolase n=1 Tax=Halobacterium yunchengense TaxID=3108497 RepID=UPI00300907B9
MLDELLGRAELKARIEDLEDEKESLRAQLDAEGERRREAVRKRQDAEERVNELEDRVTELRDRVDRLSGDADGEADFRGRRDLRADGVERVLALLASVESAEEGVLTAYVPDDPPEAVRAAFGDRAPLVERAAPCLVVRDRDGLLSAALRPPNPPEAFCKWGEAVRVEREWLAPTGRYALAVVRADLFAVGAYETDADGRPERVAFEGFTSDVKGKHSKGGFSQDRFERRRDSQIREHLDDCQDALAEVDAEHTFVVGEETLLDEFDADATAAVDATGDPEDALAHAHEDFWTVPLSLL